MVYLHLGVDDKYVEIYDVPNADALCAWGWDAAHFQETDDEAALRVIADIIDHHLSLGIARSGVLPTFFSRAQRLANPYHPADDVTVFIRSKINEVRDSLAAVESMVAAL